MIDRKHLRVMLLRECAPAVEELIAENRVRGDAIAAVGFVYEFGRGQLCFEMCANTVGNARAQAEESGDSDSSNDDARWNSGDFDYPGGIGQWSDELWGELSRLDELAENEEAADNIHTAIADVCCEVLAELATRGMFSDWTAIDFNVAALLDDLSVVRQRDGFIRELIHRQKQP